MIRITKSLFWTINKVAQHKLLPVLLLFSMLLFSGGVAAQKTWAFGTDTTNWPTTLVMTSTTYDSTIDGLRVVAGGGALGGITANGATFSSTTFGSDSYTATNRFNTGGNSTYTTPTPTKRFLSFPVTGPCTIKLWLSASAAGRTTFVSDGTTVLGSGVSPITPFQQVLTVSYSGVGGTIYVYQDAAVYIYKLSWASSGSAAPSLTPDTSANTVDNNLDISFTENATWRAAVTAVKIGTATLTAGTDYVLTVGNLQLKPSALNVLSVSGSKLVSIIANGYVPVTVTQIINAGTPTTNSTVSINPALAKNTSSTVTCTAKDQYNNLVSGYAFKFNVSRTDTNPVISESYTFNSVPYTTDASSVSTAVTDANGVSTVIVAIPAVVNVNDGVSFQVRLADAATNIGAAFSFSNVRTPQTITFGALSPVNYSASGSFSLNGIASSGLPVSYTSSNPLVATVSGSTVTIVGVGTTSITASQAGDATYDSALSVSRDLVINCGSSSFHDTTVSNCGSYTWANNAQTYSTNGTFTIIGTTTNCVTERLFLTITGSTNVTNITVCEPYTWGNTGVAYSVSGIYDGTTTNCILEKLNLTINTKNTYYVDADGDGYGAGTALQLCATTAPSGYVTTNTDCDDTNAAVWRTGTFYQDVDSDGYTDKSASICYGSSTPAGYLAAASSPSKVWNFSDTTKWPLNATGIGVTDIVNDQLGLYPVTLSTTVNYGTVGASINSFPATTTTDAFTSANRFAQGGGGSTSTATPYMPSQRYMYFDVSGSCRILIWFKTGGSGTRTLFVTDGTSALNSLGSANSADLLVLKTNYTGGAKRLYIYSDQANSIYKIEVTGANVTTPSIVAAPNLSFAADTTLNNVDNNIDITFTDNPTWRAAVTGVRIGTTILTSGTDFDISAGNLRLKPSGGNVALTVAGTDKKVIVVANGYSSSTTGILQTITAGAALTAKSTATISAALAPSATRTITLTAKDLYGNNIAGYAFKFLATITNNGSSATDSYTIDGTAYTVTTAATAITAVTNSSGVATFNVVIPSVMDSSDGISIQVKLNDGTNLGNAFSFVKTPVVTVVDNCGISVLSTNASGALLWSTGETSSSISVSTAGTYSVTQTLIGTTSASGSGVAAPIYNGITTQPVNTPICKVIGGTAVLSVVSVNPNVSYQWQTQVPGKTDWTNVINPLTGTAIYTGDTSATLSIRKQSLILPVSLTKYRVVVTGTCKTDTSDIVTITDALLPTEVVAAITSNTAGTTAGTFAAAALAVGPYVGTTNQVSYRINTFTGSGLTYYWTVPAGVSIVGQADGVTAVTQEGVDANILNVNFKKVSSGIVLPVGDITVQAQNASGCKTAAKKVTLTKALPAAPATLVMTDASLPVSATTGLPTAVTSFAKYMGSPTVLRLSATAAVTATSYLWELPTGVNRMTALEGGSSTLDLTSTEPFIYVNFAGVTNNNTDTNSAVAVLTKVSRIGVKSVNGVGSSTTVNSGLLSTSKLLTLTAVAPAAPASLAMNNGANTTAITVISKMIGQGATVKLLAPISVLASSYAWELPACVTRVTDLTGLIADNASTSTDPFIYVKFNGTNPAAGSIYFGVKAVNGVGSSATVNSGLLSTAKLLKLATVVPAAPTALILNDGITATAITVISKLIGQGGTYRLAAAVPAATLANSFAWELPTCVTRVASLTDSTPASGTTTDPYIYVKFNGTTPIAAGSINFGVTAVNGVGSSATAKLLTVTAGLPVVVAAVSGSLSVCNRPEGFSYTITAPVGATSYVITAPAGSVVSSANGVSGATPNVLTTSDLTFKVVYNGTAAFATTDKSLVIRSANAFGQCLTTKALALTKQTTCTSLASTVRLAASSVTENFNVIAYPNPSSDVFTLEVQSSGKGKATTNVQVYDMTGRLIEQRQAASNSVEVGNNYPTGIYNVIVNQGENTKSLRIIKK
jgi:hypothetical protein